MVSPLPYFVFCFCSIFYSQDGFEVGIRLLSFFSKQVRITTVPRMHRKPIISAGAKLVCNQKKEIMVAETGSKVPTKSALSGPILLIPFKKQRKAPMVPRKMVKANAMTALKSIGT